MAKPTPSQQDIQSLMLLLKTGKYAELEEKARKFTLKFPKVLGFYDLLSKAQIGQNDLPSTIRTLKKALKVKPEFVDGEYNLGVAYMSLGKVKEAIPHFENVVKQKPDYYQAHNNLGACLVHQEAFDTGLTEQEPKFAIGHYHLGLTKLALTKKDEAKACFQTAIDIQPDLKEAKEQLEKLSS